jgi:hypothetical protein
MGLRALHRHCRMPATAAALLSVLLYTALVASHIVSQATSLASPSAPGAVAQSVATGDPNCHESLPSAGKANDSSRDLPAPPGKRCPSCAGYAALHLSVVGNSVVVLLGEAANAHLRILGNGQLIASAGSHSWLSRAPPLNG